MLMCLTLRVKPPPNPNTHTVDPTGLCVPEQTKLRWLCEEVRERDTRQQLLKKQHVQTRDQLRALRRSRDSDQTALLERLDQQEKLLRSLSSEKKGTAGCRLQTSAFTDRHLWAFVQKVFLFLTEVLLRGEGND